MATAKRIVLLATVVGLPLVFFGGLRDEPFNITKLSVLLAGVSCAAALHALEWASGRRGAGLGAVMVPALALVVPLAIAWAASPYQSWALWGQFSRFNGLIPYLLFALLGALLADAFSGRARSLAFALGSAGAVVGGYAFIQAIGLDPFWQPGIDGGSPFPPSTIGHFNFAGGFLAICLPLALHVWVTGERSWPGMLMTVTTALGLVMTNSQGAWIAASAGVLLVAGGFLSQRWRRARAISVLAVGGLVVALTAGVILSATSDQPFLGPTAKTRGLLWGTAIEMGLDSPLVGRGPAAYAVEGVRYRPLEYILYEKNTVADDPHSVPLSFWANAGALGALGFLLFAAWIVRKGLRLDADNHLGLAFFAGSIAYLVQSLVTIDELSLRSGLWVSVAGLTIATSPIRPDDELSSRSGSRVALAGAAVILAVWGVWYSVGLMRAHRQVVAAEVRFEQGDVDAGQELFSRATGFRFEPRYLDSYAGHLGRAALTAAEDGGPLIERMIAVDSYLDGFPSTTALLNEARALFYWGHLEPSALDLAEATLMEIEPLDPENPEIEIRLAEVRLARGETRSAIEVLEPLIDELDGDLAGFWATLSTARALDEDLDTGRTDLERAVALDPDDCRTLTARAIYEHIDTGRISDQLATNIGINCGRGISLFREDLIEDQGL